MTIDATSAMMYKEFILDLYKNPHNKKTLPIVTFEAHKHNPNCGDNIIIQLYVKDGVVANVGFGGSGCAISVAAASLLTDNVLGKKVTEMSKINKDQMLEWLQIPVSATRLTCALLPLDAMQKALEKKD